MYKIKVQTKQNQKIQFNTEDLYQLSQIDDSELKVQIETRITLPMDVINNPVVKVNGNNIQILAQGDLFTEQSFANVFCNFMNCSFNPDLLYRKRILEFIFTEATTFQILDSKTERLLGFKKDVVYQSQVKTTQVNGQNVDTYVIQAPYKMFILYAKELNITCPQIEKQNQYKNNLQRYVIASQQYTFLSQNGDVSFTTQELLYLNLNTFYSGLQIFIQDENFEDINLEDEDVFFTFYIYQSERSVNKKQMQADYKRRQLEAREAQVQMMKQSALSQTQLLQNQKQQTQLLLSLNDIKFSIDKQKYQDKKMFLLNENQQKRMQLEILQLQKEKAQSDEDKNKIQLLLKQKEDEIKQNEIKIQNLEQNQIYKDTVEMADQEVKKKNMQLKMSDLEKLKEENKNIQNKIDQFTQFKGGKIVEADDKRLGEIYRKEKGIKKIVNMKEYADWKDELPEKITKFKNQMIENKIQQKQLENQIQIDEQKFLIDQQKQLIYEQRPEDVIDLQQDIQTRQDLLQKIQMDEQKLTDLQQIQNNVMSPTSEDVPDVQLPEDY